MATNQSQSNQNQNQKSGSNANQAKDGQGNMQNQDAKRSTTGDQKPERKDAPQRGKDETASR